MTACRRLAPLAAAIVGWGTGLHAQPAAPPAAAATIFHDVCLAAQPSLTSIEASAVALGGTRQTDKTVPGGSGRSLRQETWLIRRDDTLYQLTGMEGDAAAGPFRAVGCGVTAGEADGVALAQSLAMAGLGAPAQRIPAAGGQGASVVWTTRFGLNAGRVLLRYGGTLATGASIHLVLPRLPVP